MTQRRELLAFGKVRIASEMHLMKAPVSELVLLQVKDMTEKPIATAGGRRKCGTRTGTRYLETDVLICLLGLPPPW